MTDREKALAAAREIKSGIQPELLQVSRFSVKATADIILKHMQPDRELVEALRADLSFMLDRYRLLIHESHFDTPLQRIAEKVSKWEREK
jgi:hypothetical protein